MSENRPCPACGEGPVREVVEDEFSYGKKYHNQVHSVCDSCGFTGVNGEQMDRNRQQLVTEICGPYKPIVVHGVHHAQAYFDWGWQGCGFGQLSFSMDKGGKITCMNECMGREAVRKLLHAFADYVADNAVLDDE